MGECLEVSGKGRPHSRDHVAQILGMPIFPGEAWELPHDIAGMSLSLRCVLIAFPAPPLGTCSPHNRQVAGTLPARPRHSLASVVFALPWCLSAFRGGCAREGVLGRACPGRARGVSVVDQRVILDQFLETSWRACLGKSSKAREQAEPSLRAIAGRLPREIVQRPCGLAVNS